MLNKGVFDVFLSNAMVKSNRHKWYSIFDHDQNYNKNCRLRKYNLSDKFRSWIKFELKMVSPDMALKGYA